MVKAVFWSRSEQRSPAFVHLHDFIKKQTSSLRCRDVEDAVPLHLNFYRYMVVDKDGRPQVAPTVHSGKFLPPQNRYALCGFYFVYWDRKSGAEICSPTPLYYFFYCCVLLFLYLHRLVGLRLLRLCPFLVSEVEQEIYSARDSVP